MSAQELTWIFEQYMAMDPSNPFDRNFMESKRASLARSVFLDAQRLELIEARLERAREES